MPDVYIRLFKNTKIEGKTKVYIKDIATVGAIDQIKNRVNNTCILSPSQDKPQHYVVTIMDVIDEICKVIPTASIQSVGEMDAIVDYNPTMPKSKPVWEWLKVFFICTIIFAGTTVAIIAYQTDVSLRQTFSILYEALTGNYTDNPVWITVPYSIGMPLGILIFFNHIGTKKFTNDPTPIQIEIDTYDTDAETTIINMINQHKRGQEE